MTNYRIFMIDSAGRILTASDVECLTDSAAFAWASVTLGTDARAEIWRGSICVGSVAGTTTMPIAQPPLGSLVEHVPLLVPAGSADGDCTTVQFGADMQRYVNDNVAEHSASLLRHE